MKPQPEVERAMATRSSEIEDAENVKRILSSEGDKKEFCTACGPRTIHKVEVDEQEEKWKICNTCGKRAYVGQ